MSHEFVWPPPVVFFLFPRLGCVVISFGSTRNRSVLKGLKFSFIFSPSPSRPFFIIYLFTQKGRFSKEEKKKKKNCSI